MCLCVLYLSVKGFEFNTCEKAKPDGNTESVSVVEAARGTNMPWSVLLKALRVNTLHVYTLYFYRYVQLVIMTKHIVDVEFYKNKVYSIHLTVKTALQFLVRKTQG